MERAPGSATVCSCETSAFTLVYNRLATQLSRRTFLLGAGAATLWPYQAQAQTPDAPESTIVFTNVRVFDGTSEKLSPPAQVVVQGNKIISSGPVGASPMRPGARVFDGANRTLMPGLIDAHWHAMMAPLPLNVLLTADIGFITLAAAQEAERTLLRGFTSVRDMAGPTFSLKRAIDAGMVHGPRIWPSGAMISQTGGHGDFRYPYEVPSSPNAPLTRADQEGMGAIADGVDAVSKRAREQLMLGASQVKLAAGGGVASAYDPIDAAQYTDPEFRAAVDAAENWGTYVAVHAYTSRAIATAVRAGVTCVEHGQLMDEATAHLLAEKDIWLSTQAFISNQYSNQYTDPVAKAAKEQISEGTDRTYEFAKKYKLKTAWGTDILFDPNNTKNQGAILATLTRWYSNVDILRMATATNAQLLAKSGPRSPYPGPLGVIKAGAYADLLLVDGDPIEDINVLTNPADKLLIVMKDGRIYKNTLPTERHAVPGTG